VKRLAGWYRREDWWVGRNGAAIKPSLGRILASVAYLCLNPLVGAGNTGLYARKWIQSAANTPREDPNLHVRAAAVALDDQWSSRTTLATVFAVCHGTHHAACYLTIVCFSPPLAASHSSLGMYPTSTFIKMSLSVAVSVVPQHPITVIS